MAHKTGPKPTQRSAEINARIHTMRQAGASWPAIAAEVGVPRSRIAEYAARNGLDAEVWVDLGREPLSAGHPISWGAIVGEGVEYGL